LCVRIEASAPLIGGVPDLAGPVSLLFLDDVADHKSVHRGEGALRVQRAETLLDE
jgi:hypothetical protein